MVNANRAGGSESAFVRFDPRLQSSALEPPGCNLENRSFGLVDRRHQIAAVQPKEREHDGVTNSLVAIDERVVLDEGEAQRSGLAREALVQILTTKGLPRLRYGGLQCAHVPNERLLPGLFRDEAVEKEYLS